ncbi:helix-turn-helix transcriptional regulator [Treponema primitia]|uniref:helix-turn-helix transcriptional regulator n=1 Tax=Treponema primitia TaxID=88058 RepID=UPI001E4FE00C|nr:WYL domain-containing protein [Treponema primitia]
MARIYSIERQIASGSYPNVNDLAEKYGCGTATIYRDIEYMRDRLNAPIEYDAKERGWYFSEKGFRLPARYAASNDMLALGMAKSLLELYKNTPLYESAKHLIEDITAPLSNDDIPETEKSAWYEKRIIVPSVASAPVKPEIWEVITTGLRDNRVITFDYKGHWDAEYNTRLVRPYQLLFDTGIWYLYGYSEEREATRLFSLQRMKNASLTNETFKLPQDFDYNAKNNNSHFGIFEGKKQNYRIQFSNDVLPAIEERQWAEDQKIEDTGDECFILSFSSTQFDKVLSWVLSFGCNAAPIEPAQLVASWERHITELYAVITDKTGETK